MFCTSLRSRKDWASAVSYLLQYDKMKFRGPLPLWLIQATFQTFTGSGRLGGCAHQSIDNKIDTHDVNMPLPSMEPGQRYLRFILLSSANNEVATKLQRVERLYHQSGGSDAAVVWLLGEGGNVSSFMQFQIELVSARNSEAPHSLMLTNIC